MRKPGVVALLLACLVVSACASAQGARQAADVDGSKSGDSDSGGYGGGGRSY